ncbi:MAG: hypothetical protein IKZ42_06005 [Clostridiales bacterium]|nr:hypothetical protein [Clostridiales bacterium]
MKRILRKVTSIFVATFMVAAMGVTALATELPATGVTGSNNPADALETTLVIKKDLKVYNPSETAVYGPGVSYSYTIAPGTAEKQITDADGIKALTKAGVGEPTITGSLSYPNDEKVTASSTGASNLKDIEISFANVTFPGAGVYRYVVTETCSNKAACAVVGEEETTTIRYLDVYVRDPESGETGYKIYGYVLFVNNNNIDGTDTDSLNAAVKTQGFVDTTVGSTTLKADAYYTYNLEVSKTLVNDAANDANAFPFTLAFTKPSGVTGDFNLIADADPLAMDASVQKGFANGDSVKYIGIPCGTTVEITEQNNVTAKIYYVTTTGADANNLTDFMLEPQAVTDAVSVTTATGKTGLVDKTVAFTNTYVLISPTGVALAILPFVILLGFGVGFMVVGTAKRKEDEA